MKTVVLGIGNTLLCDDGVGIYALNQLQSDWNVESAVEFIDGGTLSFTLTEVLYNADNLIVIDAAQLGTSPGNVKVFTNEDMDDFVSNGKCSSVHEVSLAELLDMARLLDSLPNKRALIGVQPERVDWSAQPTEAILKSIPLVCREATNLLAAWH